MRRAPHPLPSRPRFAAVVRAALNRARIARAIEAAFLAAVVGACAPNRELSLDLDEDIAAMLRPIGWEVEAEVVEDHYSWVDDFRATHATHGAVGGSFEFGVEADSAESIAALIDGINTVGGWRYWDHADI